MKISRLAMHKLNSLFGSPQREMEIRFIKAYLNPISYGVDINGLSLKEVERFCSIAEEFGVLILGLETLYESKYGLHVYIFEEYNEEYEVGWWLKALAEMQKKKILDSIFPRIEITPEVLKIYPC